MISDKKLAKISLTVAIIGIFMIFFASQLAIQSVLIGEIRESDAGKQVVLNGTVSSYRISNGNVFFKLSDDTGNIAVVMFERAARGQNPLENGNNVTVKGQLNVYKNELEIIANSILKVE